MLTSLRNDTHGVLADPAAPRRAISRACAIRAFAGEDGDLAVVEAEARAVAAHPGALVGCGESVLQRSSVWLDNDVLWVTSHP
jgi:hypothetical protein